MSGYNLPELLNLDLPISHFLFFFFFFLSSSSTHPPTPLRFGIANQPMCFLTGEAGDKERGVGRFSNRSMLFIFDCIYFILSVYLSLCHYMNVWFLAFVHTNAGGFLPVRAIKMDSVFVCVIWLRLRCIQACTQGMGGYRKCGFLDVCVCVWLCEFLRGLLCLRDCEFGKRFEAG